MAAQGGDLPRDAVDNTCRQNRENNKEGSTSRARVLAPPMIPTGVDLALRPSSTGRHCEATDPL
jgi:hypothetical protein